MADTIADMINALNGPNLDWLGPSEPDIHSHDVTAVAEQLRTEDIYRSAINGLAARLGAQGEGLTCSPST